MTAPAVAPPRASDDATGDRPDRFPSAVAGVARADVAMALIAAAVMAAATWWATRALDPRLLRYDTVDVWFEADLARVFENMTSRWSNHTRANVHPLFALFVLPVVTVLRHAFALSAWDAVRVGLSMAAAGWAAGIFAVLRLMGCRRPDAIVFTLLGMTSAGAMFWFAVPETHTVASLSIVLALLAVAFSTHRILPLYLDVAVGVATLGVTVTNWMAGILATWSHRSLRTTIQVSANALVVTVVLWAMQKRLAPSAAFFLGNPPETGHILAPEALGSAHVIGSFFMHTVVMPAITVVDRPGAGEWPIMIVQPTLPGSAGPLSLLSAILWGALLATGAWSLVRLRRARAMRIFLATFVAGQLALHLLFGNETFLYAGNFLPALIVLAALGTLGPTRRAVLPIAMLLAVTNTANNGAQWVRASRFLTEYARYHHDDEAERAARPDDPWPAPRQFRRLAVPGVRNFDRAFVSSRGSFSPALDQFTISIWVHDDSGRVIERSNVLVASSERSDGPPRPALADGETPVHVAVTPAPRSAAKGDASQTDIAPTNEGVGSAIAHSPFYDADWEVDGPRRYTLEVTTPESLRVDLVVRGVGASEAPVRHLQWDGEDLTINGRWVIDAEPGALTGRVADEHDPEWASEHPTTSEVFVEDGWGVARLEVLKPGRHRLRVYDVSPRGSIDRRLGVIPAHAAPSRQE